MYSYFIKATKGKFGWAPLYVVCRTCKGTTKINTGVEVPIDEWAKAKKNNNLEKFYGAHEDIRKELLEVEKIIRAKIADGETSGAVIGRCIRAVAENRVNKEIDEVNKAQMERGAVVVGYFGDFLDGLSKGSIKPIGRRVTDNTIRMYGACLKWLTDFLGAKAEDFRFKDVTKRWVSDFKAFVEDRTSAGTLRVYLSKFRSVARYALTDLSADGYPANPNAMCLQLLRGENVERIRNTDVVLTEEAIKAMLSLLLTGREAQARDLFVWQCYCGQRYSDVVRTTPDCFTFDGCPIYRIVSQKTGTEAVVPIVNPQAQALLERNNYQFAKISESVYNQLIKRVCRKLAAVYSESKMVAGRPAITFPLREEVTTRLDARELTKERHYLELKQQDSSALSLYDRGLISLCDDYAREHGTLGSGRLYKRDPSDETGRTVYKYKWELISSHTARRTFATNEFYAGLTAEQVASETGHRSTLILNKAYNKTTRAWLTDKIIDKKANKNGNNTQETLTVVR